MKNPFSDKVFVRIQADRNIIPEQDRSDLSVDGNGTGATNILQNFVNKAKKNGKSIWKKNIRDESRCQSPVAD